MSCRLLYPGHHFTLLFLFVPYPFPLFLSPLFLLPPLISVTSHLLPFLSFFSVPLPLCSLFLFPPLCSFAPRPSFFPFPILNHYVPPSSIFPTLFRSLPLPLPTITKSLLYHTVPRSRQSKLTFINIDV